MNSLSKQRKEKEGVEGERSERSDRAGVKRNDRAGQDSRTDEEQESQRGEQGEARKKPNYKKKGGSKSLQRHDHDIDSEGEDSTNENGRRDIDPDERHPTHKSHKHGVPRTRRFSSPSSSNESESSDADGQVADRIPNADERVSLNLYISSVT